MTQIRKLIYQNRYCLVRHVMHKKYQDESEFILPKFLELSCIAYMKDDAYRYNICDNELLNLKYADTSDSDSDLGQGESDQVLSNFYSKAIQQVSFAEGSFNLLENIKNVPVVDQKD